MRWQAGGNKRRSSALPLHNRGPALRAAQQQPPMIYKFKSAATGDLLMLGAHGDLLLQLLGRVPAARGIIEVADMPAANAALLAAIAQDEAPRPADDEDAAQPAVGLRQRLWPMIELLRRAQAADAAVVWGV